MAACLAVTIKMTACLILHAWRISRTNLQPHEVCLHHRTLCLVVDTIAPESLPGLLGLTPVSGRDTNGPGVGHLALERLGTNRWLCLGWILMVMPHPRHPNHLLDSFLCHPVTHSFKLPNSIPQLPTAPQRTKIEILPRNLPELATLMSFLVTLQAALRSTMVIFRPIILKPRLGLQICSRIPFILNEQLNNLRRASTQ